MAVALNCADLCCSLLCAVCCVVVDFMLFDECCFVLFSLYCFALVLFSSSVVVYFCVICYCVGADDAIPQIGP